MHDFHNWAERYSERFVLMLCFSVIVLALSFGVQAWMRRRRNGSEVGANRRFRDSVVLLGVWGGLYLLLLVVSVFTMSPFLMLEVLALLVLSMVGGVRRWSTGRFSVVATVIVMAMILVAGVRGINQAEDARRRFPFTSLVERLKPAAAIPTEPPLLTKSGEAALERSELIFENGMKGFTNGYHFRRASLEMVHASQVWNFVSSEGFGIGRMLAPTIKGARLAELRTWRQPVALETDDAGSTGDRPDLWLPLKGENAPRKALNKLHENLSFDFAEPVSFGWVRDLEHVTGFRPHAVAHFDRHRVTFGHKAEDEMSAEHEAGWKLERVELVSLLRSVEPGVYVSKDLPRMDRLSEVKRRPLDGFETVALRELRNGEPLVIRSQGGQVKMMGAVRAVKQCSLCHEVPRGTLLGAFSYGFRDQTSASASE